jgi:hypothetical protein
MSSKEIDLVVPFVSNIFVRTTENKETNSLTVDLKARLSHHHLRHEGLILLRVESFFRHNIEMRLRQSLTIPGEK